MTATRKLALTALLFLAAVALLATSAATKSVGPLFGMWIPLLAVPWVLVRPEPGDAVPSGTGGETPEGS